MKPSPMQIARSDLLIGSPFFGVIGTRLRLVEDKTMPTAATNGRDLIFNPEWFNALKKPERVGLVAHEVLHVAMLHHTRRGNRNPELWNVACDYAINLELRDSGFTLPEGGLVENRFKGMGAEKIYKELAGNPDKQPKPQEWGEIQDAPGKDGAADSSEIEAAEAETKIMVGQAMQQAKAMGKLPAGIERALKEILTPKINWRDVMQQFIQKSQAEQPDWRRPNRRMVGQGFYLPRIKGEFLRFAVAVDTSGSIGEDELSQFMAEVSGMLSTCTSKAWIIYADAEINRVDEVTSDDLPLQVKPCGGGGTDFRPVFEWLEKLEEQPSCLLYITDMYGTFPENAPEIPVLWVKTTDEKAPWGEEVKLDV